MDVQASEAGTVESTLQYNVTGTRVVAALIDMAVIIALFVVMALAWGDTGKTTNNENNSYHMYLRNGPFVVFLIASFAYYLLLEGLFSATLGKIVMGLRVVKIDGSPCTLSASLIRNLVRIVDQLPAFYLVGFVVAVTDQRRQRLGDRAAQTLVVRAR